MIPAEFGIPDRTRRRWGIVALAALVVALIIGIFQPVSLFGGYLAAFVLVSGVPLGAASIILLFQLTGGRWGRGFFESLRFGAGALPLAVVLAVPIYLGVPWLYPWFTDGPAPGSFRAAWLSTPEFLARGAIYVLIWFVLGIVLGRAGEPGDRSTRKWAGPVLTLYLLSLTFAAIDWIGSLEQHWYSTILGLYLIVGQALSALALLILVAVRRPTVPDTQTLHDWGNLLLTFVVLHAYMAYSQFFVIWNGNLPHEIVFYVHRTRGVWGAVAVVLIIIEFLLPFAALLARNAKRNAKALATVAAVILAARVLDTAWMVLPALPAGQLPAFITYLLLAPGLVWFWLMAAGWLQTRLLPSVAARREAPP